MRSPFLLDDCKTELGTRLNSRSNEDLHNSIKTLVLFWAKTVDVRGDLDFLVDTLEFDSSRSLLMIFRSSCRDVIHSGPEF